MSNKWVVTWKSKSCSNSAVDAKEMSVLKAGTPSTWCFLGQADFTFSNLMLATEHHIQVGAVPEDVKLLLA